MGHLVGHDLIPSSAFASAKDSVYFSLRLRHRNQTIKSKKRPTMMTTAAMMPLRALLDSPWDFVDPEAMIDMLAARYVMTTG